MVEAGEWDVEFYADEQGREPCRNWADDLSPQKRAAFAAAIRLVLARRGLDVVETEFAKALGSGLYELRVRWSAAEIRHKVEGLPPDDVGHAPEKILLRVFFCTAGRKIILLIEWLRQGQRPRRAAPKPRDRQRTQARHGIPGSPEAQQEEALTHGLRFDG